MNKIKNILITGTSGFVGHHIVEHILKNTDWSLKVENNKWLIIK